MWEWGWSIYRTQQFYKVDCRVYQIYIHSLDIWYWCHMSFQLLKSLGKNCRKIQLLLQATFSGPRKYVLITKLAQSMLVDTGWFLMRTGPTFSPSFRWNLFTNCTVTAEFYNHCDLRICCCCCCCWVASVASDSVRPRRRQPTRLPRPWDSPGRNTGVGCRFLTNC